MPKWHLKYSSVRNTGGGGTLVDVEGSWTLTGESGDTIDPLLLLRLMTFGLRGLIDILAIWQHD
jgi:hypothetical protein